MRPYLLAIVFVLILCPVVLATDAQGPEGDITVQADGFGISKNDALLRAKRNAVEKGIGTVLISHTEVKNFELQKDVILSKTMGAVRRYEILNEKKDPDGTYFISISALVSIASIKSDLAALKILLEAMDKPRIMVLLQEENGRDAEHAIQRYLKEKEFDLVDAAAVAALMQKGDDFTGRAARGDPAAAAQLGAENGAEYVIVGMVTKSVKENQLLSDSGMISGQANVSAKVVNCSNARVVASNSASGAAYHVSGDVAMSKAAEKAAVKLMDRKLLETIIASFQDQLNNGVTLVVVVNNVPNFETQKAVRATVGDLPDVVSLSKKSFGGGKLMLTVQFKGNADTFSENIDGKPAAGKHLSVTDIAGSRVIMVLE